MARLNLEDRLFGDPRLDHLSIVLKCNKAEALGKLAFLWHASQEREVVVASAAQIGRWCYVFEQQEVEQLIGGLVAAEFVFETKGGYEIKGNREQVGAIKKFRARGAKGGRATKKKWDGEKNEQACNTSEQLKKEEGLKPSVSHACATLEAGLKPSVSSAQYNSIQFNSIQGNTIQDNTESKSMPRPKKVEAVSDHDNDLGQRWAEYTKAEYPFLKPKPDEYAQAIAKVRRTVGLNDEQLDYLFEFVQTDEFWKQNCQSPVGLLRKSKNGLRKIDNILSRIKSKVQPTTEILRWAQEMDRQQAEMKGS